LAATVSRLVVDLNRSRGHRSHLSEFTRTLAPEARRALVERYWLPHRQEVERLLAELVAGKQRVLHVAVHAFAPEVRGVVRKADVALLYDPGRPAERALAERWCELLAREGPGLRIRRNYPFRGVSDGLTTHLRRLHPDRAYAGIELEVNTRFARQPRLAREMRGIVGRTLAALIGRAPG
jgi:predicted N-formylglutamate amidohydrolase